MTTLVSSSLRDARLCVEARLCVDARLCVEARLCVGVFDERVGLCTSNPCLLKSVPVFSTELTLLQKGSTLSGISRKYLKFIISNFESKTISGFLQLGPS